MSIHDDIVQRKASGAHEITLSLDALEELVDELKRARLNAQTQAEKNCKLQDDVAAIVSSHRSDWSWDDVLSDVRALKQSSLTAKQRLTVIDALNDAIMLNEGAIEGATLSQGQPPFTPEETEDLVDELERLPRFKELLAELGGTR